MAKRKTGSGQYPLRLPDDLRLRIEKAAKGRNISLNAAILERLEETFQTENRFGGPQLVEMIETIAAVMKTTGEFAAFFTDTSKLHNQGKWLANPYAFDQATKAAIIILEHHRPPGKVVAPKMARGLAADVAGTDADTKRVKGQLHKFFKDFAEMQARGELIKREQDDD